MSAKKNSMSGKEERKGKVKVGKLQRNREAVTDLTGTEQKQIEGGFANALILRQQILQQPTPHAGCPNWSCTSNHNETLVRDAAPMK